MSDANLEIPDGLSPEGRKAAELLLELAGEVAAEFDRPIHVGCRTFYTPAEWVRRGETYGSAAELIVVHDGGDFAPLLNLDYCCYDLHNRQTRRLEPHGVYASQCTGWYTAVYKT